MATVDPHDTLLASVRVQTAYDRKVLALLRQATRDVTRQLAGILGDNVGDVIRRDQLRAARAALLERAAVLNRAVGGVVADGKIAAAIAADRELLKYDAVLMQAYDGDARIAAYLKSSAITSSQQAVELAERRLLGRSYVPLAEQVYRTGAVSAGLVDSVVNSALARGLSAEEFAKEAVSLINPSTPGGVSYASMRLARTELNNAFHARAIDSAREKPWVEAMLWNLSGSHPRPDQCNDYADDQHMRGGDPGVFAIDDVPSKPHPQCVTGDTRIAAEDIIAVIRSRHLGSIYRLHFRSGQSLDATPNHPILGLGGWLAAADIKPGDQVIQGLLDPVDGAGRGDDVVDGPPTIEEIYNSAAGLRTAADRIPVTAGQFHGDGQFRQGSVDVVRTDGHLRHDDQAEDTESLNEFGLSGADLERHLGSATSALRERGGTVALPSASSMGWCDHCGSPIRSEGSDSLLTTTQGQSCARHSVPNLADADAAVAGRFREALAAQVGVDEVTVVERVDFDGHVYNLQTRSGWYLSNGTASKNCLCFVTPVEEDEDAFLDNLTSGNYDDYIDSEVAKRQAANVDRVQATVPTSPSSSRTTTPPRPNGRRVR